MENPNVHKTSINTSINVYTWNAPHNPTVAYFQIPKTYERKNARGMLKSLGCEKQRLPKEGDILLLQIPSLMIALNIDGHGDYFTFGLHAWGRK